MTIHYEFSRHAIERFAERFPMFDLVDSFQRSTPVPARRIIDKATLTRRRFNIRIHDKFFHDPISDCLFICQFNPDTGTIVVITCFPWMNMKNVRKAAPCPEYAAA